VGRAVGVPVGDGVDDGTGVEVGVGSSEEQEVVTKSRKQRAECRMRRAEGGILGGMGRRMGCILTEMINYP
jgi:hypothetical protein